MEKVEDLLFDAGNVRPTIFPARRSHFRAVSAARPIKFRMALIDGFLLPPPPVRLRLDEALENARRGREVHVFGSHNPCVLQRPLKVNPSSFSFHFQNAEQQCLLANTSENMAMILRPTTAPTSPTHPFSPKLRGDESYDNWVRNRGSLVLRSQLPEPTIEELIPRCGNKDVKENMRLNRTDEQWWRSHNPDEETINCTRSNCPPRVHGEAEDIYLRGRGLAPGGMKDVLNQGWSDINGITRAESANLTRRPKAVTPFSDETNGRQVAELFAQSDPRKADVNPTSQPKATGSLSALNYEAPTSRLQNGAAMAVVLGGDKNERLLDTQLGIASCATGPRTKFEGVENALRNRGTLTSANLHSQNPEPGPLRVQRIRPEAQDIAALQRGTITKLLMTKIESLMPDPPPKRKVQARGRKIANMSQGGAMKECINPSCQKMRSIRRR